MNLKNTSKHKLIVVFLSLIMVFSMTSCGTKEATIVSGSSILPMPTKKASISNPVVPPHDPWSWNRQYS